MIYSFRTNTYARNVFYFGNERLTARDGYNGVPAEYYTPVEQRAADIYPVEQLQLALSKGWINQQEYDETVALKTTV